MAVNPTSRGAHEVRQGQKSVQVVARRRPVDFPQHPAPVAHIAQIIFSVWKTDTGAVGGEIKPDIPPLFPAMSRVFPSAILIERHDSESCR